MSVDTPEWGALAAGQSWQQIEELVDQIEELSRSDIPPQQFHAGLLDRVVKASAAAGGAVWVLQPEVGLQLDYQINLAITELNENDLSERQHRRLLEELLAAGLPKLVPPHSGPSGADQAANPTPFLLICCPLQRGEDSIGVVEIFQRPDVSPAARDGFLQLLISVCQLATDYYRHCQLRELRNRETLWSRFSDFSTRIHQSLDLKATAYTIANDGRQFIGCDRLSVVAYRRSRCRVLAISGAASVDRRASTVRSLERLAKSVLATDQSLYYIGGLEEQLPPQIERPLNEFLDDSNARTVVVIPLREDDSNQQRRRKGLIGALVVEHFDAMVKGELQQRLDAARDHVELAFRNAFELHDLPLSRLLRRAGWLVAAGQLPRTVLVSFTLAALVLAMIFVTADFEIEVDGQLHPKLRRDIFAPRDGVVSQLVVDDEKQVQSGDLLVVLRNPQLDLEFKRVWGEIQTASKKLSAVQAARVVSDLANSDERVRYNQLAADAAELQALLKSLKEQHEILKQQQAQLNVCSPIAGHVLTWSLQQLLENRPVKLGQVLMRVADTDGPWVMELSVPDHRIGHVLEAQRELGQDLRVSFILATDPNATHDKTIGKIAMSTELDDSDEPVVLVNVDIEREEFDKLRPGATVIAKIYCGRRSIGYVWLHDLFEAIQTRILF